MCFNETEAEQPNERFSRQEKACGSYAVSLPYLRFGYRQKKPEVLIAIPHRANSESGGIEFSADFGKLTGRLRFCLQQQMPKETWPS